MGSAESNCSIIIDSNPEEPVPHSQQHINLINSAYCYTPHSLVSLQLALFSPIYVLGVSLTLLFLKVLFSYSKGEMTNLAEPVSNFILSIFPATYSVNQIVVIFCSHYIYLDCCSTLTVHGTTVYVHTVYIHIPFSIP